MKKTLFAVFMTLAIVCSAPFGAAAASSPADANAPAVRTAADELSLEIEAANGQKRKIDFVDAPGEGDFLAVLTSRFGEKTNNTSKYNVAVQVNGDFTVTQIANKAPAPNVTPTWQDSANLDIPPDGFVLLAVDTSYSSKGYKKFAAENFGAGDRVKLSIGGQPVTLDEFKRQTEHLAQPSTLVLDQSGMYTVGAGQTETVVSGKLTNFKNDGVYKVLVNGQAAVLNADGTFSYRVPLQPKTNYVEIDTYRGTIKQSAAHSVVYRYMKQQQGREVYLWIEQSTNLNKYTTSQSIRDMLVKAKDAGVTAVAFPVKGHEGYASYLKNDLSGIPHISQIKSPSKAGVPADLDVLQEYIKHCRELGLRIDAVFNLYGAGSGEDSGLTPAQFNAFEELVYRPEDGGRIVPIRQSAYEPPVYFMNPANEAAQAYQLQAIEEVMRNYDVDAVVFDRARYDNIYADFSDLSRRKFEQYLAQKGKALVHWPHDIMKHEYDPAGKFVQTVRGPLFIDWLTFRSTVSRTFYEQARAKVNAVNAVTGKRIPLAISMGAWFASYYEVGQNWSSPNFRYDPRLGLPLPELYTPEYQKTAFGTKDIFEYMILGTYYNTPEAVMSGITLMHVLTQEEFPVFAGFQLQQLPDPEDQRKSFQMALNYTNGLKLFDLSVINWDVQKAALANVPYVKSYQAGISVPAGAPIPNELKPYVSKGFIEADYYNQNRSIGSIGIYSDRYGQTTGTPGSFGVEAIVGANGKTTDVVNKQQAMTWNWAGNRTNNSPIPQGGFVVSTIDRDGVRTLRQLIAYAYSTGNDIRAAVLRGHNDYRGKTTDKSNIDIKGSVEVLGPGTPTVRLNGNVVPVDASGNFSGTVSLPVIGKNTVSLAVYVDGHKTNAADLEITRTESALAGLDFQLPGGTTLYQGARYETSLKALYSDGSSGSVTDAVYSSSDPAIAAIGTDGTVTAKQAGRATITASSGGKSAGITVEVKPIVRIKSDAKHTLQVGQSYKPKVTAVYGDGVQKTITDATSSSSRPAVATVAADGTVTARKPGMTVIAISYYGKKTEVKVKVVKDRDDDDRDQ